MRAHNKGRALRQREISGAGENLRLTTPGGCVVEVWGWREVTATALFVFSLNSTGRFRLNEQGFLFSSESRENEALFDINL